MTREAANDLFQTTFIELHQEAPTELIKSFRERLEHIRAKNPQSAQTAEACLRNLAPENSTLLHVLTAAYLINGGVMLKHIDSAEEESLEEDDGRDFDFKELEEELSNFTALPPEPIKESEIDSRATHTLKNLLSTD